MGVCVSVLVTDHTITAAAAHAGVQYCTVLQLVSVQASVQELQSVTLLAVVQILVNSE